MSNNMYNKKIEDAGRLKKKIRKELKKLKKAQKKCYNEKETSTQKFFWRTHTVKTRSSEWYIIEAKIDGLEWVLRLI